MEADVHGPCPRRSRSISLMNSIPKRDIRMFSGVENCWRIELGAEGRRRLRVRRVALDDGDVSVERRVLEQVEAIALPIPPPPMITTSAAVVTARSPEGPLAMQHRPGRRSSRGLVARVSPRPSRRPSAKREVHAAHEILMLVDECVERAVSEAELARLLVWLVPPSCERLDEAPHVGGPSMAAPPPRPGAERPTSSPRRCAAARRSNTTNE